MPHKQEDTVGPQGLNEYLCKHLKLRDKIKSRTGVIHGIKKSEDMAEVPDASMDDDCFNDSDVPSSLVIQETLDIMITESQDTHNDKSLCLTGAEG